MKQTSGPGLLRLWYLLVPSVHQAQDRTRLPADGELIGAAVRGAELFLQQQLEREIQRREALN